MGYPSLPKHSQTSGTIAQCGYLKCSGHHTSRTSVHCSPTSHLCPDLLLFGASHHSLIYNASLRLAICSDNVEARLPRCRCRPAPGHDRPRCVMNPLLLYNVILTKTHSFSHTQPAGAMGRCLHLYPLRRACLPRFAHSSGPHLLARHPHHLPDGRICVPAYYRHARAAPEGVLRICRAQLPHSATPRAALQRVAGQASPPLAPAVAAVSSSCSRHHEVYFIPYFF